MQASVDKGIHGFSRVKTTPGIVILVDGRQPIFLGCLASRRLSSVKNSERLAEPTCLVRLASRRLSSVKNKLADRSGALSARQRTQAYRRMSRTITQQTAFQAGPQARMPLSADASIV